MHLGDAAAEAGGVFHPGEFVDQKHQLPVGGAGDHFVFGVVGVAGDKARVLDVVFAAQAFEVGLPAFAVGRVGEHEIKLPRREGFAFAGETAVFYVLPGCSPARLRKL